MKVYPAKVFKSGNSVALRLPKALGLTEGMEMTLREDRGRFIFQPADKPRKIDLTGIAGSIPDLQPLTDRDREIEERELDWDLKRMRHD